MLDVVRNPPERQLAQASGGPKVERPQQASVAVVQGQDLAAHREDDNLAGEEEEE